MANFHVDYVPKTILLPLQLGDITHGLPVSLNSAVSAALSQKKAAVCVLIECTWSLAPVNYGITTLLI
jgi:hypothetical protein